MTTDDCFCLRVRNLPTVLSNEAITSFFTHYGAIRVRVLQHRNAAASSGKEPGAMTCQQAQKVIATFATREAQQNARQRLHLLEIAGHHLQVEVVGEKAATTSSERKPETVESHDTVSLQSQLPPLPKGLPPPLPRTGIPMQKNLYAPVPLAPHLGLNYAPSPLLEYKYPKASESIVRNIANALIALPRFYTQVLHLMNKMNLPPPFEEDAIPGRFSIKQSMTQQKCGSDHFQNKHVKRRRTEESLLTQIIEEEEEEASDHDDANDANASTIDAYSPLQAQQQSKDVSNGTDRNPKVDQNSNTSSRQDPIDLTGKLFTHRNKCSSIKKSATLHTAFQLDLDNGNNGNVSRPIRPGVISENEVNRLRLSREELMKVPQMKSYVRGFPSSTIVVNNISHTMDEKDLRSVFGYVLPLDMNLDLIKMKRRPAKGSVLISYPDEVLAIAAVNALHGVQLEGKPLMIGFNTTCEESSDASVVIARWTLQDLEQKRLLENQLASEKAMKKYERGEASDTLYVKNLAQTVELADLFAVFGAVLPPESGPDDLNIRHFTVGRMKCQAFVKYTTVQLASKALHQVHGVVLKDKPLIVCFRKSQSDTNQSLL
ncbi:unnamed protein product [Peronospora farinosa]|uniref:RRM domain-containing protein n=1 Tax=Peronospora farinosa TaxID=134698 RepID=A0AAV0TE49_9STRA|nr:unnamed protein product [Peronospora farinosa]